MMPQSADSATDAVRVSVEVKRIQTFLFAVPRLKAMVGANTILGETLRGCWIDRDKNYSEGSLARLAVECGAAPPPGQPPPGNAVPDDPLGDEDDPVRDWNNGILARDGGRFIAAFDDAGAAERFVCSSRALLQRKLPGALVQVKCRRGGDPYPLAAPPGEAAIPFLPQFQVCMESGTEPASQIGLDNGKSRYRSNSFIDRMESAKELARLASGDPVGLFYRGLRDRGLYPPDPPEEFAKLCGKSYLAVLHADGNNVGRRLADHLKRYDSREHDARTAEFFHRMRVAVRGALAKSIQESFPKPGPGTVPDPFRILMLGGDDLLMVMRAEHALPFAVAYAKHLAGMGNMPDGQPLDIGCGVVIARPSFPFFRLHIIAEELAASAKRLVRGVRRCSVIDWHVTTDSHMQRVRDSRRRWVIRYESGGQQNRLVLSRRPMSILAPPATAAPAAAGGETAVPADAMSLERLHGEAEVMSQSDIPRSPLRALADELYRGRLQAQSAFREFHAKLDPDRRQQVPWLKDPWEPADGGVYLTRFLDLVEILEIPNLKTQAMPGDES
ncbi:MAG TPA: hypothetical protein PK176_11155 [Acidobacteriota bacterium]|nr:hypothetical protein [Acidobacteriota bacterium]HQM63861.1 hypothetical protein [Acidobacteriota bacterium]